MPIASASYNRQAGWLADELCHLISVIVTLPMWFSQYLQLILLLSGF